MSTATAERAPSTSREVIEARVVESTSWLTRAADATVRVVESGWNWFTSAVSWCWDKAVAGVKWLGRSAKTAAFWLWDVGSGIAVGTWEYTEPFRNWIATPFRLAFGSSALMATLLVFGPVFIILVAVPWVAYLLDRGSRTLSRKEKASINEAFVISDAESRILGDRTLEVEAMRGTNVNPAEIEGRLYLLAARAEGRAIMPGALFEEYKAMVAKSSRILPEEKKQIRQKFAGIRTGMHAEDRKIRELLAPITVGV